MVLIDLLYHTHAINMFLGPTPILCKTKLLKNQVNSMLLILCQIATCTHDHDDKHSW